MPNKRIRPLQVVDLECKLANAAEDCRSPKASHVAIPDRVVRSVNGRCASRALGVAQVSNLLYRRLPACRPCDLSRSYCRLETRRAFKALPIGNRRYGRLETCATTRSRALRRSIGNPRVFGGSFSEGTNSLDCSLSSRELHCREAFGVRQSSAALLASLQTRAIAYS